MEDIAVKSHMQLDSWTAREMRRHKGGGRPKHINWWIIFGTEGWRCYRELDVEEEEEEEEVEGDAGQEVLRENVYRLWFINSWAVSKSSKSSEPLWIEAKKIGKWKCNNCTNEPSLLVSIMNKWVFSTNQSMKVIYCSAYQAWADVRFAFQLSYINAGEPALPLDSTGLCIKDIFHQGGKQWHRKWERGQNEDG